MIKIHRLTHTFFILLASVLGAFAQINKDDIQFDKTLINFGNIEMEGGIVIANYTLTNNGSENFEISAVEGTCGCTNVRASNRNIKPGESAIISAEFDPKGLYGTTTKSVYVRGNLADAYELELKFKANIKSVHQRDPNAYYPGEYGYLVFQVTNLSLGQRKLGFTAVDSIYAANDGYRDIVIESVEDVPPFISFPNLPLTLKPKEKAFIQIVMDSRMMDTVGPYSGTIDVKTTDQFYPKKEITYAVDFEHDYSKLKKRQLRRAPKMYVEEHIVQLGRMKSGAKKSVPVTIMNTGKRELKILRIETDCTCAVLNNLKKSLAPGESMIVQAQFDSLYKEGNQSRAITLYTNDPSNPRQKITLRALVE